MIRKHPVSSRIVYAVPNTKTRVEIGTIGVAPRPEQLITPDVPQAIVINLSKVCNLWCHHCFYPDYARKREKRQAKGENTGPAFLTLNAFKLVADEMGKWNKTTKSVLRVVADGEPLLNPKALDMLAYAKKVGVPVALTTNGIGLYEKNARQILEIGTEMVDISIDAATPETYAKVRRSRGGINMFPMVDKNVRELIRLKKEEYPNSSTKITVNMIDQPLAHADMPLFIRKWKEIGADVVLVRPFSSTSTLTPREGVATIQSRVKRFACRYPFTRLNVGFDEGGHTTVYYCSHDWEKKTVVGLLGTHGSLKDLWNGRRMKEIRRRHRENDFPKSSFCANCPDWYLGWGKFHQGLVEKAAA